MQPTPLGTNPMRRAPIQWKWYPLIYDEGSSSTHIVPTQEYGVEIMDNKVTLNTQTLIAVLANGAYKQLGGQWPPRKSSSSTNLPIVCQDHVSKFFEIIGCETTLGGEQQILPQELLVDPKSLHIVWDVVWSILLGTTQIN